jgi:hypothetical protein
MSSAASPQGHEVVPALQRVLLLAEGSVGTLHALRRQPALWADRGATRRRNGEPSERR